MRLAFLLAILVASAFYTWWAFTDLAFLSRTGRLGPGFFPRIIGISLMAFCLASLGPDVARMRHDALASPHWALVGGLALMSGGLVFLFGLLGGTLSMAVFLLVALSILNRGRHVANVSLAAILPLGIYLIFDVWLNAAMPEGLLHLPI